MPVIISSFDVCSTFIFLCPFSFVFILNSVSKGPKFGVTISSSSSSFEGGLDKLIFSI